MKKSIKILIAIAVVIAVIVGAAAIAISPVTKNYIEKHDRELLGRSIRMDRLRMNVFTGRLRVEGLRIGGVNDSTTFFRLDSFDMRLKLWPLLSKRVEVPYVRLVNPDVKVYQNGTEFNFDGILDHFASDTTQVDTTASPWAIGIHNIAIRQGHLFYKDIQLDATWGLNDISLDIPGVYFSGEKTDVGVVLNFSEGGSLATQVGYDMESQEFDIAVKIKNLTLGGTLPYFQQSLNVSRIDGRISTDINLRGDVEHLLSLRVDGTAGLAGFAMHDMQGRPVATIDTLDMTLAEGDLGKLHFRLDRFYVGGFSTFVELTPKGNNLMDLMKPSAPQEAAVENAEQAPKTALVLQIADLRIKRGSVAVRDKTLHRAFEYHLNDIGLRCRNFDPAGRNDILAQARLQKTGTAKLRWVGSVDDINNQNITLSLANVGLKDFAPYSEHFTAYPLTTGNLTFRSQNVIRNRNLDGTNHLDMFEPKVDKKLKELSPEFKIPLKLGLYILKDKKGHVKMDLPVKGSLDSPEFSYRKIVLKAIGNVLLKVVTAPFSFLSGHKDNLEYIDIDPQQYAFSSEQFASLDKIAQMMQDKPEMNIALTQRLNMDRALPKQADNVLRMAYATHLRTADSVARIAAAATPSSDTTAVHQTTPAAPGTAEAISPVRAATGSPSVRPPLSLLEYEKIQQIDIRDQAVMAFADSLLAQRGIASQGLSPEQKAVALYREQAVQQLARMASMRDKSIADYMLTTHGLTPPKLRVQQADSAAAQGYAGHNRYTIALEVDGESVEIAPADSVATPAVAQPAGAQPTVAQQAVTQLQ